MPYIAEDLAKKQREISIAEFFEKNKHMLGFDSPTRALFTCVKETVDNSLDACEEADMLPNICVVIEKENGDEFLVSVLDSGPGVVKEQVGSTFGKMLYGSRFHSIKQSRGQQGIGVSACVLYSQLSTGNVAEVTTKIGNDMPAYSCKVGIDTRKNTPLVRDKKLIHWERESGTEVKLRVKGRYVKDRKQSIFEYLKETSIVNPHARISLTEPNGTTTVFERVTERMPPKTVEVKPHPNGIEIGQLIKMVEATEARKLTSFLVTEFSRIGYMTAREIGREARLSEDKNPAKLTHKEVKDLYEAMKGSRISAPGGECLSPITETLLKRSLKRELDAEFIAISAREPNVYSGHPFRIESAIAYVNESKEVRLMRFANKVPLLYQQGECAITRAIGEMDWRRYGLSQRGGKGLPEDSVMFLVHIASTNVPFTSETKEAVAAIPEIMDEIKNSLRECARKIMGHVKKREQYKKIREKEEIIREILPMLAEKCASFLSKPVPPLDPVIAKIMNMVVIRHETTFGGRKYRVKIWINNYTGRGKNFTLYSRIPDEARILATQPRAKKEDSMLVWKLPRIGERFDIEYELGDLEKGDYDDVELYVKGIDPEIIDGAQGYGVGE